MPLSVSFICRRKKTHKLFPIERPIALRTDLTTTCGLELREKLPNEAKRLLKTKEIILLQICKAKRSLKTQELFL
jgi:hypothetical protein